MDKPKRPRKPTAPKQPVVKERIQYRRELDYTQDQNTLGSILSDLDPRIDIRDVRFEFEQYYDDVTIEFSIDVEVDLSEEEIQRALDAYKEKVEKYDHDIVLYRKRMEAYKEAMGAWTLYQTDDKVQALMTRYLIDEETAKRIVEIDNK